MADVLKYYQVLKILSNSSQEDIKQSYRELAKVWHPDHNKDPKAIEKFQHISQAYNVLSNPVQKMFYDVFSIAYKAAPAPDMLALKPYKNQSNKETSSLRALTIFKGKSQKRIIASYSEAKKIILLSLLNIKNYNAKIFNAEDNLQILLHNALAYNLENNDQMANTYAQQALEFATTQEQIIIKNWQNTLKSPPKAAQQWNYNTLNKIKYMPIIFTAALITIVCAHNFFNYQKILKFFNKKPEVSYFQKVTARRGVEIVDDHSLGKIINYPVDVHNTTLLYHTTQDIAIKHGPSEKFDTLSNAKKGQTVRLTGQTPDNAWARVLIDNGQMGYIRAKNLKKGIKNPIPKNSKINS